MSCERFADHGIDYHACRYEGSGLFFRGPKREVGPDEEHVVVLGGTETFGPFMEEPYPAVLEVLSGRKVINLGSHHAGLQALESDPAIAGFCARAQTVIIQITSAAAMSNRFYGVHPRRNDRFTSPRPMMRRIFADVDFTGIHFVGHLVATLVKQSPRRFGLLREELCREWLSRMRSFVRRIPGRVILLWVGERSPEEAATLAADWRGPHFVDRAMLEALAGDGPEIVEIVAMPEEIEAGHARMLFQMHEAPAAHSLLGPVVHQEIARQLAGRLG